MTIYSPNKTSAKLMLDYAFKRWGSDSNEKNCEKNDKNEKRLLLIYDLYIKARSYAIINKIAFIFSILVGIMVLLWPSVAIVAKDLGCEMEFLKSAIVQTTVTGLAAIIFAIYSHYKKRQMYTENLMRHMIYSNESDRELVEQVVQEIEKIDSGFSFSKTIETQENKKSDESNAKKNE